MFHSMSAVQTEKELRSNLSLGLTQKEADKRIEEFGENKFKEPKKKSFFRKFLEQMNDSMIIVLLVSAIVSFGISFLFGEADFVDPIMILVIVTLNSLMGIFWESKAQKALDALKTLSAPEARVMRDGRVRKIPVKKLVPGDVIFLKAGDIVPADARLFEAVSFYVNESALTGESCAVEKTADVIELQSSSASDIKNCVFSSSTVVSGNAKAMVTHTGMNTQTGKIADMLIKERAPRTPLQERLSYIGKILSVVAVIICVLIFIIGVLRKIPVFEMFMTAVGLAVAAIPEGLPAIVTILLSLGVSKMAAKNAIVRQLTAVETLGSATVICSDKTGTLTENKMKVVEYFGDKEKIISLCAICSNGSDPTEQALLREATENTDAVRIKEIPFSSERKMMSVVVKTDSGYRIISKGAPDVLLEKCSISSQEKKRVREETAKMAKKALRVIAVAYRDVTKVPQNMEENLIFTGLAGIADPPRKEVKEAVKICKKAGIKVVMITGDSADTAKAVGEQIGIEGKVMTGEELSRQSGTFLHNHINEYRIFARVAPEHKVKIVRLLQEMGETAAMTGDGINDAPALKCADIGCAMGISGSDVAKNAADIILTDDNFATIVEAVKQGRGIYDNIKKALRFLLSCNIGEILTIFVAILCGVRSPLAAVQLLWINLVTDSLPAVALGMENPAEDIMSRPPINRKKGVFSDGMGVNIVLEGIMIAALSLLAYTVGKNIFCSADVARTMTFCVLSLSQLTHAFNMRSDDSVFKVGFLSNKYMVASLAVCAFMQVLVVSVPAIAPVFKAVPLSLSQWVCTAVLSVIPFVTLEIEKLLGEK